MNDLLTPEQIDDVRVRHVVDAGFSPIRESKENLAQSWRVLFEDRRALLRHIDALESERKADAAKLERVLATLHDVADHPGLCINKSEAQVQDHYLAHINEAIAILEGDSK